MSDVDSNSEALARDVDLDAITSSEYNAFILETLRDGSCTGMGIMADDEGWADENDFVVREGDDLFWLGHYISESQALEYLWLSHLPSDDSFRQGLAQNKSIQKISIWSDLGEAGFQSLAHFFRHTTTLKELVFNADIHINSEAARTIASLLRQCQIKSLNEFILEGIGLPDGGFADIARALSAQPQLEVLGLWELNVGNACPGLSALGSTMKNWKSSCLKKLTIEDFDELDDGGLLRLVEGMTNCPNLECLSLKGNESITLVGFNALSTWLRSKNIFLETIDFSSMNIDDDAMTALASGLASLQSLKWLDLSRNVIGAVGLQALAAGMKDPCALEELDLSGNSISCEGWRSLTAAKMNSLRRLSLDAINNEALKTIVDGMENLCNLETLCLDRLTSSGLTVLATTFHSVRSSLKVLDLQGMNIGDSGAEALAEGLMGNKSLTELSFDCESVTFNGWSVFERFLCDTSSVNSTYHSNHTLEVLGSKYFYLSRQIPSFVKRWLTLNKQKHDNVNVPICKILMSHSDFDMTPFFQWKLKLLPSAVMWFERARPTGVYLKESTTAFEKRKLSAVYQFISGFSHMVADAFYSQKSSVATDRSVTITKKRKFESDPRVK